MPPLPPVPPELAASSHPVLSALLWAAGGFYLLTLLATA